MHETAEQLVSYVRAAWRYRWHAIVVTWVLAMVGWAAVDRMPDQYEVRARVYVDTQSVLRPLLSGIAVQPNVDQAVAMMSRTLVSRPNLEKVIEMAELASGTADSRDREALVDRLSRELAIRSAGRENLYTIAYTDVDRERAQRVVQSLLTIFMERSMGDKRRDSDSAQRFIEEQLQNYSEKLVAAENAVTEFKRKHQGLVPGEGRDFYGPLIQARTEFRQASIELKEAVNSRDAIKRQLADEARALNQSGGTAQAGDSPSELGLRIRSLEQKLDSLRLTYTDKHPDIVSLMRMIDQLRVQEEAESKEKQVAGAASGATARAAKGSLYEQLMVSLATAEASVAAMKARVAEYEVRYNDLQAAANALPQVEAEYKQLTRDYEVIKARYDKLLERRESAQISGDVEASDAAMGFRIIDPPAAPVAPSAPNRPQLMSIVLLAALAGGFGVAFVFSQIKTTFDDERKLREATGLRVLGSVPMSWNDKQKTRRTKGLVALALSYLSLLSAYAAIMASLLVTTVRT